MHYSLKEMAEESQKQHFVLVHGASHGAWCWYKLRYHLQNAGHTVTCLDLAGAGIDLADPNFFKSFHEYNKPLSDFLSNLPPNEKVVLVGHSAGGLNLTWALHEYGEQKISLAIFLAAMMLPYGVVTEQHKLAVFGDLPDLENLFEYYYANGLDNPPTSMIMKKEFQREAYYHMSPEEDSILASMLLRPSSILTNQTAQFSGGDFEKVRRVFIKTLHDRMATSELQDSMIKDWPPKEVMTIDSEHSPFFSAPEELSKLIIKASNSS